MTPRLVMLAAIGLLALAPSSASEQDGLRVSESDLGDKWPLTEREGLLRCDRYADTFTASDGSVYAVNGTAKMRRSPTGELQFKRIEPIWRHDPKWPELRVNIGPLIDLGLKLCPP